MDFKILSPADKILFIRNDAESAEWTQEEMTFSGSFPFLSNKIIERGQRILFQDSEKIWQCFEIRGVQTYDSYQQITGEHIAISELTDEHIESQELKDVTPKYALNQALTGTNWTCERSAVSDKSSGEFSRGSVWQAVNEIRQNWNVYIEPRITVDSTGITGRYLDIVQSQWRGLRLSFNKNFSDPCVNYDDTELVTALYGYGEHDGKTDKDLTFSDIVWSKTDKHPSKAKGKAYLEDFDATKLYGRNGKPRFGYYQNAEISDANVLLQKTWETLQTCNKPKVSISGTLIDLYRLGYADTPVKLHDTVLIEIQPIGVKLQKEIIQCRVDLLNPANTAPTIGDYIPNIIYINREANDESSGSTGGSSGRRGGGTSNSKTGLFSEIKDETEMLKSHILQTAEKIELYVQDENKKLYSKIEQTASSISLIVDSTSGKVTPAKIVAAINNGDSSVLISASKVSLSGKTSINDVMSISGNYVNIKRPTRIDAPLTAQSLSLRTSSSGITLTESMVAGMIMSASVSGNTLTLTPVRGSPINFSKATTLGGSWSSRRFTVTASPQGNSIYTTIVSAVPSADISWSGSTGTATLKATVDGGETAYTVGTVSINGTGAYNNGWLAAGSDSSSPTTQANSDNITVKLPSTVTAGATITRNYYLVISGTYCELRYGSRSGVRVARLNIA